MTKENLKEIMKKYCIVSCEIDDVIYFVQDLLEFQANELKKTEPYAVNSIRRLEDAAYVSVMTNEHNKELVYGIVNLLDHILLAVEEDENVCFTRCKEV